MEDIVMHRERYLSDSQLAHRYSVHRVTIWRWSRAGQFPQPVKLTPGTSRWRLDEILEFESQVSGV